MGAGSSTSAWWCQKNELPRPGAIKDFGFFADGSLIQKHEDECVCQHHEQSVSSCASTASGGFSFCSNESGDEEFVRTFEQVVLNLDMEVAGIVDDGRHDQFLVEFATNFRSPVGPTEPLASVVWEPVTRRLFAQDGESAEDGQAFHETVDDSPSTLACQLGLSSPSGWNTQVLPVEQPVMASTLRATCCRPPLEHCLPSAIQRWKQEVIGAASSSSQGSTSCSSSGVGNGGGGCGGLSCCAPRASAARIASWLSEVKISDACLPRSLSLIFEGLCFGS